MGWQCGLAAASMAWAGGVGQQHGGGLATVRGSWERAKRVERSSELRER